MSVVNVKVSYIRPKYSNLQDWINDPNNVYIGRKGIIFINNQRFPKENSIWHNPYKLQSNSNEKDREFVLQQYEIHLKNLLKQDFYKIELQKLKGKNLGCWCKPNKCHGDILLKYINN